MSARLRTLKRSMSRSVRSFSRTAPQRATEAGANTGANVRNDLGRVSTCPLRCMMPDMAV